jgi:hypothetical protein
MQIGTPLRTLVVEPLELPVEKPQEEKPQSDAAQPEHETELATQ